MSKPAMSFGAWKQALFALLIAAGSGCASVPPGYGAVLVTASGGVQSPALTEGIHVLPPLAHVDLYNLRGQERTEDIAAIAADGAPVQARASLVTYHVADCELPDLDRQVGPDYYQVIILPIVRSTVRRVIAQYPSSELSTPTIRVAQSQIARLAAERMRPFHIILDSLDLRTLAVLLSEHAYAAVMDTGVLEQRLQETPQTLEVARRRGEVLREKARSIAGAHELVAPTLTANVLADDRLRAFSTLLTSPTTRVVVGAKGRSNRLEIEP